VDLDFDRHVIADLLVSHRAAVHDRASDVVGRLHFVVREADRGDQAVTGLESDRVTGLLLVIKGGDAEKVVLFQVHVAFRLALSPC